MRQWDYKSWTLTHNDAFLRKVDVSLLKPLEAFKRYRPEVDILPGITWKCSMRSAFSWFSEFCHSRRLSHFAASFIVTRAEASIAENCDRIRKSENTKKNSRKVLCEVITWHLVTAAYKMRPLLVAHEYNSALQLSWTHSKIQVWKWIYLSCKWSFRRFTYGNLVTTSPSSKW